jgi:hypothetical protein
MSGSSRARKTKKQQFPAGWNEKRVRQVLEHYENQSEEEAVAEDEAAFAAANQTVMIVPTELVPEVRRLIAKKPPGRAPRTASQTRKSGSQK